MPAAFLPWQAAQFLLNAVSPFKAVWLSSGIIMDSDAGVADVLTACVESSEDVFDHKTAARATSRTTPPPIKIVLFIWLMLTRV